MYKPKGCFVEHLAKMKMQLFVCLLCLGIALLAEAQTPEPSPSPESTGGNPVYSNELDSKFTPCG